MYNPAIKAFNYALDHLSRFKVPGLPGFREDHRLTFARTDAKCISPECYLQGSCKPDIVLLKWGTLTQVHNGPPSNTNYSDSYESDVCCKSAKQPTLGWRQLLSTVEVKHGGVTKVHSNRYHGDFSDLKRAPKVSQAFESLQPPKQDTVVSEGQIQWTYRTHDKGTRSRERPSVPSSQQPPQKRTRIVQDSEVSRPGQASRIQSAIYASHKISSSFDVSHTITFTLIGTSLHLTWINRQNIIESQDIDLVDNLPHFLLLLLVLQRFDDAKWGHFTGCSQSGITVVEDGELRIASFDANADTGERVPIAFYPEADEVQLGITVTGRGTNVIGARLGPSPSKTQIGSDDNVREGNNLVVKIYWPEESRKSEVEILKKAKECGEKIEFIRDHIPQMVGHLESNFLCSSTKTVRQFLGLPTEGSRRLRIIVFRRLVPIKKLEEKEMLTAYLQCFFCHRCLWIKGIHHGDISPRNLMWDAERKVGVLNDFDLAKFADQTGASGRDNTGTLPFMALDLLSEEGLRGGIRRRYRHEAESFAWTLICLHLSIAKDKNGRNSTRDPHPLKRWFIDWEGSQNAKVNLGWPDKNDSAMLPVYPNVRQLAITLHDYWLGRYNRQRAPLLPPASPRIEGRSKPLTKNTIAYKEEDDVKVFQDLVNLHDDALSFRVAGVKPLEGIQDLLVKMYVDWKKVDWTD